MNNPKNQLIFATTNPRKIAEATKIAKKYNVTFDTQALDIDEIQHYDPLEVTKAKARAAHQILQQPVVVHDSSWEIPALGGFPGAYMHDIILWFKPQDWLNLIAEYPDKSIIVTESIVYVDDHTTTHFQHKQTGHFTLTPKGSNDVSIEKVVTFTPDGKTIAEQHDIGGPSNNSIDLTAYEDFFKWYSTTQHHKKSL